MKESTKEIIKKINESNSKEHLDDIYEILKAIGYKVKIRNHVGEHITLEELMENGYSSIRIKDSSNDQTIGSIWNGSNNFLPEILNESVEIIDFIEDSDGYFCVVVSTINIIENEDCKLELKYK